MKVRVIVSHAFPVVRDVIGAALTGHPYIEVVATASDGAQAREVARRHQPDVMIVGPDSADPDRLTIVGHLREELPLTCVMVILADDDPAGVRSALRSGASGYLTERATTQAVCDAVLTVHGGGTVLSAAAIGQLARELAEQKGRPAPSSPELLRARDTEILRLVARGLTDRDVAARLYVSTRTVQNALNRIRERTGLHHRAALTRWAVEHKIT